MKYIFIILILIILNGAFGQSSIQNLSGTLCANSNVTFTVQNDSLFNVPINIVDSGSVELTDDSFSSVIPIGFNFEFFGNVYSNLLISSNNLVTFDTTNAGLFANWEIGATIPSNTMTTNSIMLPFQDLNPTISNSSKIRWATIGQSPNRVFIVSFDSIAMFSCTSLFFTSQVHLYENCNIIETHILEKDTCNAWNNGSAIHGLQNIDGTQAVVVGNRNYPVQWTAQNDGRRFTPDGSNSYILDSIGIQFIDISNPATNIADTYTVDWYIDSNYVSTGDSISFNISQDILLSANIIPSTFCSFPVINEIYDSIFLTTASFNYEDTILCKNQGLVPVDSISISGTFSSFPAGLDLNPATGEINTNTSIVGSYMVYNQVSSPCVLLDSLSIHILQDSVDISYVDTLFCNNSASITPSYFPSSNVKFGPLSSGIDTLTGIIDLLNLNGNYDVYITWSNACIDTSFFNIDVLPAPSLTINTNDIYCPLELVGAPNSYSPTGGIFSSTPGLIVDSLTGEMDLVNSNPGTYGLTYTYSDGTCSNSVVAVVDVNTAPCDCDADVGTFTVNSSGLINGNQIQLCYGDTVSIQSNNDWTPPDSVLNNTLGIPYEPSITWLLYSCPPTVALGPSITQGIFDDPCLLGTVGNNDFNDLNDQFWITSYPGTFTDGIVYFVPITMYDTNSFTYSYVNTNVPCYHLGNYFSVQYLPQINVNLEEDCNLGIVEFSATGGISDYDGSNYTVSNILPSNATLGTSTFSQNDTISLSNINNGQNYSFEITDDFGCTMPITGGPIAQVSVPNVNLDTVFCELSGDLSAVIPVLGTGNWAGPNSIIFDNSMNNQTGFIADSSGIYPLSWTISNGGCSSTQDFSIYISTVGIMDSVVSTTNCSILDGEIILEGIGLFSPFEYSVDAGVSFQTSGNFSGLAAENYSCVVKDQLNCTADSIVLITVENYPIIDTIIIEPSNCIETCNGSIEIIGQNLNSYSIDGINYQAVGVFNDLCPSSYLINVQDNFGCELFYGNELLQETYINCNLIFYSGITPNDDNINDTWIIDGLPAEGGKVTIVNRWGDDVWSSESYDNSLNVWKGRNMNDEALPPGVYYYIAEIGEEVYNGFIELSK